MIIIDVRHFPSGARYYPDPLGNAAHRYFF